MLQLVDLHNNNMLMLKYTIEIISHFLFEWNSKLMSKNFARPSIFLDVVSSFLIHSLE